MARRGCAFPELCDSRCALCTQAGLKQISATTQFTITQYAPRFPQGVWPHGVTDCRLRPIDKWAAGGNIVDEEILSAGRLRYYKLYNGDHSFSDAATQCSVDGPLTVTHSPTAWTWKGPGPRPPQRQYVSKDAATQCNVDMCEVWSLRRLDGPSCSHSPARLWRPVLPPQRQRASEAAEAAEAAQTAQAAQADVVVQADEAAEAAPARLWRPVLPPQR